MTKCYNIYEKSQCKDCTEGCSTCAEIFCVISKLFGKRENETECIIKMRMDNVLTKVKEYEVVYKSYVNDIYRLCLYYLKDEEQAVNITQQAFLEFYKTYDKVHPDYMLGYLVREVKGLLPSNQNHQSMGEEVK